MLKTNSIRYALAAATGTMLLLLVGAAAYAQDLNISPTERDRDAASQVQNSKRHILPVSNRVGRAARSSDELYNEHHDHPGPGDPAQSFVRYPGDLNYHGGQVMENVEQYLIYVNVHGSASCSSIATCWGDPHAFLHDLGKSDFVHVLDQYVGKTDDDRYRVSDRPIFVNYPTNGTPLTDNDMLAIIHSVATSLPHTPTGYDHLYHVFLTPGQDECFDSTYSVCYSPDNQTSWYFCAYHSYADFNDIGHVLYTVQPFNDVHGTDGGCAIRPGTPNGQVIDSTNNALSHETFESISDPDITAWWNGLDNGIYGQEIADECIFVIFTPTARFTDSTNVILNGRSYSVQPEYSNSAHACTVKSESERRD